MNIDYTEMTPYHIEKLSDIELKNAFMILRSKIIFKKKDMMDSKDLEIAFCYVTRELQLRN